MVSDDIIDSNTEKLIKREIQNSLNNFKVSNTYDNNVHYIYKNIYKNNDLTTYKIPINLSDDLMKIVAEFSNNSAVKNIRGYESGIYVGIYKKDEDNMYDSIHENKKILEFIEEHYSDEFNPNKEYYILDGNLNTRNGYKSFIFYTNNTKEIDSILKFSFSRYE